MRAPRRRQRSWQGALQDHERAEIVGEKTYGKGSVQTFLDLPDGSGLKLTTSRYYTPAGKSLHDAGITPDIRVVARPASSWRIPADRGQQTTP